MHQSLIIAYSSVLIIKPPYIKGNEHVLQDLFQSCFSGLLCVHYQFSPRGMKGPYCLPLSNSVTAEWIEAN